MEGPRLSSYPVHCPQEMSPCSRNVGAPAPENRLPLPVSQAARGCPLSPLPPRWALPPCPASVPSCPHRDGQGGTLSRQGALVVCCVFCHSRCGGSLPLCPPPLSGEKGPLISGEGCPGNPSPPAPSSSTSAPPSVAEPRRLRCPSLLQWACPSLPPRAQMRLGSSAQLPSQSLPASGRCPLHTQHRHALHP